MALFNSLLEDKGVHIFPKSITSKVKEIAWLEFELAYLETTLKHFNHYANETPPPKKVKRRDRSMATWIDK